MMPIYDPPIVLRRPLPRLDAGPQPETTFAPPGAGMGAATRVRPEDSRCCRLPPRYFYRGDRAAMISPLIRAMPPRPNYASPARRTVRPSSTAAALPASRQFLRMRMRFARP